MGLGLSSRHRVSGADWEPSGVRGLSDRAAPTAGPAPAEPDSTPSASSTGPTALKSAVIDTDGKLAGNGGTFLPRKRCYLGVGCPVPPVTACRFHLTSTHSEYPLWAKSDRCP